MIDLKTKKFVKILNNTLSRNSKVFLFKYYNKIGAYYNLRYGNFKKPNYPSTLSINLTNRCNINCTICDRDDPNVGLSMDFENLAKLEKPIAHAKVIDLTGWGEAITYKKYPEAIKYIKSINNTKKLFVQTSNGTAIDKYTEYLKGRIHKVVISLNAATKETYEKEMFTNIDVGRGKFTKTLKNIEYFMTGITKQDRLNIRLHFVTYKENYLEMPAFVELANSLGIKSVSFGHFMAFNSEMEQLSLFHLKNEYNEMAVEAEKVGKKFNISVFYRKFYEDLGLTKNNCTYPFDSCFISPEGEIYPCCYIGDISMGNVFQEDFDSIWYGKKIQKLREAKNWKTCNTCAPFHSFDKITTHRTSHLNILPASKKLAI